jgi:hypothetical protein
MTRYLPACCLTIAACLALSARADVTYEKTKEGENKIAVIRMTVTPAAEPVPALRYRLLARSIDLKSGNAAPYYRRAAIDVRPMMTRLRARFDEDTQLSPWYGVVGDDAMPVAKLPLKKLREANQFFDPICDDNLQTAFERSSCDWELGLEDMRGLKLLTFLLQDVQQCREAGRMLMLRTRLAIAEKRYDDAITSMRYQYRIGSDVAKMPFLVCGLLGLWIDGMNNSTLIELIASQDSPNMYWALSVLPQPLIDLRPTMQFEMDNVPRIFPFTNRTETAQHAPQEWNRLYTQTIREYSKTGSTFRGGPNNGKELDDTQAGVVATGLALAGYSQAKASLIAQGMDRDRIEKMSVGQVIAIYTERLSSKFSDENEKLWYMPYADMHKAWDALEKRIEDAKPFGRSENREIFPTASVLTQPIPTARVAQVRVERDLAAIQVIEALRMFAADHDGKLPKTLNEITAVPVPNNPATGKAFKYRLDGQTAVLDLPRSDKVEAGNSFARAANTDIRFEIQIAAKK